MKINFLTKKEIEKFENKISFSKLNLEKDEILNKLLEEKNFIYYFIISYSKDNNKIIDLGKEADLIIQWIKLETVLIIVVILNYKYPKHFKIEVADLIEIDKILQPNKYKYNDANKIFNNLRQFEYGKNSLEKYINFYSKIDAILFKIHKANFNDIKLPIINKTKIKKNKIKNVSLKNIEKDKINFIIKNISLKNNLTTGIEFIIATNNFESDKIKLSTFQSKLNAEKYLLKIIENYYGKNGDHPFTKKEFNIDKKPYMAAVVSDIQDYFKKNKIKINLKKYYFGNGNNKKIQINVINESKIKLRKFYE